jgi:hypothetical protein
VAVVLGLRVDVPGEGPALGVDVLQQAGLAHAFFEARAVDGGEGFDRDKAVGAGGAPSRAVLGEATPRNDVVDVGVVLQWPAPGVQDAGDPREVGPDAALVGGEPLEGRCRGVQHGLGRKALVRAEKGTQGLRDGAGEEEVRSGQLCAQVVCEPLRGCMLLTLGAVAVATGMIDAVLPPTGLALIEAVAIMATLTMLDGAEDLSVCGGEVGRAFQVCWRKGGEDGAEGGHGRSPCMRVVRRS